MPNLSTTIVKVQLPIATTGDAMLCLVYDKDRRHQVQQEIPQRTRDLLKGDSRGFFDATWDGKVWHIGKRLPEQFW